MEEDRLEKLSASISDEIDSHVFRTEKQLVELEYENYFDGEFSCSQIENTATYSIIPSCYMLFETNLVAFSNIAKEYYFLNLKYNELGGGKTEKIKKYLRKLAGIDISAFNSWNALMDLEVIRNCIVHNEGKVNEQFRDTNKIEQLSNKYSTCISINTPLHEKERYLIIKFPLCDFFLEQIESFFDELIMSFGFHQNFYYGSKASQQLLEERINAKKELDTAIQKAKDIYNKRLGIK